MQLGYQMCDKCVNELREIMTQRKLSKQNTLNTRKCPEKHDGKTKRK